MMTSDAVRLTARIAELEAENESLREARGERSPDASRSRRRGASIASAVLVVLGLILGTASVLVTSASNQLLDTERFMGTFGSLAEEPEVQKVVIAGVMDAIDSSVDIPSLTAPVFDGIESLGLAPRAASALGLLRAPVNQGLHSLIETQVGDFVRSSAFADIWATTLRTTHTQLVATLQGRSDAAVSIGSTGTIELQIGPVVAEVRERLIANGMVFAQAIPAVDRSIVLVENPSLASLPALYALTAAVATWLPWLALVLITAGIWCARNRRRALIATSIAALGILLVLAAALAIARVGLGALLLRPAGALTPDALRVLYDAVTSSTTELIVALSTIAIITTVAAWLGSTGRTARAMRGAVDEAANAVRSAGERRDLTTGAFGLWLDRHRALVLATIVVVAAAIVFLNRPISVGVVLPTAVIATFAALLVPFLRRSAPTIDSPAKETVHV